MTAIVHKHILYCQPQSPQLFTCKFYF